MKVGKFDIPGYRLDSTLLDAAKKIYDTYKAEEGPSKSVAELLGHKSEKSGAYLTKIADLRAYGLLEKRGIRITDLGKRITYGRGEEKSQALKDAVLNIPLWKIFYETWGTDLPSEDFWAHIGKIVGLEAPAAKELEKEVREAYLTDIKNLRPTTPPQGPGVTTPTPPPTGGQQPPQGPGTTISEKRELIVNINIQVNLPEKGDPEQYDKIFAAIKKNLFPE